MLKDNKIERPAESCPNWPQPGRLWSYADLMKEYRPSEFAEIMTCIDNADEAYEVTPDFDDDDAQRMNDKIVRRALSAMQDWCDSYGDKDRSAFFQKHYIKVPRAKETWEAVRDHFIESFGGAALYRVDFERRRFLNDKKPFGDKVSRLLKPCERDLEQACRCLAFGVPTAGVFHLMRACEVAVGQLCQKLGYTNTEKEWGKLLADIDAKIKTIPKPDRARWAEIRQCLWMVKEATRNETMHPRGWYTQEQGEEVFDELNKFMNKLVKLL